MTARRDGCFDDAVFALNLMGEEEAARVLRAVDGDGYYSADGINGPWYINEKMQHKIAAAVLRARKIHEKGKT